VIEGITYSGGIAIAVLAQAVPLILAGAPMGQSTSQRFAAEGVPIISPADAPAVRGILIAGAANGNTGTWQILTVCGSIVALCALVLYLSQRALQGNWGEFEEMDVTTPTSSIIKFGGDATRGVATPRKRKLMLVSLTMLAGTCFWTWQRPNPASSQAALHSHNPTAPSRITWPSGGFTMRPFPNLAALREQASRWPGNASDPKLAQKRAIRTHFSDVMVIVHFNNLRYDVNYDGWRHAYADYFPNLRFYGPGTWEESEDKNFDRMHEMIAYGDYQPATQPGSFGYLTHYMGMRHDPGYRGYLWVNFDLYLNISSLQHFDKDRVWSVGPQCRLDGVPLDGKCKVSLCWGLSSVLCTC
jgi:hypothetical protein